MNQPFTAILLSGGKSTRMGEDKSQLIYMNSTFLKLQAEKLKRAGAAELLISSDYCTLSGWETVKDIYKNKGPMCGIYSGMKKARYERCFVLSVDSVGVTKDLIYSIVKEHEKSASDVTLLRHSGIMEPLIGVYNKSLIYELEKNILQDKLKLTRLIYDLEFEGKIKLGYYDINAQIITNCNTRQDYENII